ncbi:hypothetical protein RRG08_060640 [Elysia crispata]|uniref:Uncharacterized protein n=1 Tax=Elysia crispata TaxID=231223 RepID=A0AAE0Z3C1_9GAST|nr:hypothetical protein RRG08_060640 [Elysia crispata]
MDKFSADIELGVNGYGLEWIEALAQLDSHTLCSEIVSFLLVSKVSESSVFGELLDSETGVVFGANFTNLGCTSLTRGCDVAGQLVSTSLTRRCDVAGQLVSTSLTRGCDVAGQLVNTSLTRGCDVAGQLVNTSLTRGCDVAGQLVSTSLTRGCDVAGQLVSTRLP